MAKWLLRTRGFVAVMAVLLCAVMIEHASGGVAGAPAVPAELPSDIHAACGTDNPYLTTACGVVPIGSKSSAGRRAALALFRDTPGNKPHFLLASYEAVGSVHGVAYDAAENAVYAAAYHRRQVHFGPGGPGAIYRVDLSAGSVAHWATVPDAGDDLHDLVFGGRDVAAGKWAGKTSLGDIDLDPNGDELYVVNMADRNVYRFEVPSGRLLGRFSHGAKAEPWAEDARPFGLEFHEGRIYHGLVQSGESSGDRDDLNAYVYSSLSDGSDMRVAASVGLQYQRGHISWNWAGDNANISLRWRPWTDRPPPTAPGARYVRAYAMPMLIDIDFDADGNLIIGLADRMLDMALLQGFTTSDFAALGAGDLLLGRPDGGRWSFAPVPEHFVDHHRKSDESVMGGLASVPWQNEVVASGWLDSEVFDPWKDVSGAHWFMADSGRIRSDEVLCPQFGTQPRVELNLVPPAWAHDEGPFIGRIGDLELMCPGPQVPEPSATPTAAPTKTVTSISTTTPTFTAVPTPTEPGPTASASPTVTPVPEPLHLPLILRERCDPEYYRSDIALVIDTSSSMAGQKIIDAKDAAAAFVGLIDLAPGRSQVAVVRYDREAEVVRELTRARSSLEAAIRSLHVRSGTHIDKGLRAGLAELQSPRHVERNAQVLILLTDGVQTGTPGEELRAAAEVREAGVRVYAIGLGSDVDEATLRTIAGSDERYYFAPESADLARIYGEIAVDLACPGRGLWGG